MNIKPLIIYYSLSGNTRAVADVIANSTEGILEEIVTVKKLPANPLIRFLIAGKQAVRKEKPEIKPLSVTLSDFPLIFIGTPVWASTYTPAIRSLFSKYNFKNRKLAFFCCCAASEGRTFKDLTRGLPDCDILGAISFKEPKRRDWPSNKTRAANWALSIVQEFKDY